MNIFEIKTNIELYYKDIDQVIKRLSYPISKESCTNVVLANGQFVGAYNYSNSVPLGVKGGRINWLAVTNESEINKLHTGKYIITSVIEHAKIKELEYVYISVNIENKRALSLYTRLGFLVVKAEGSEQDMRLCIL